jgi:hypothetical protein
MTPFAVLVLVTGVMVVLVVAGAALVVDARRRGRAPSQPRVPPAEARSAEARSAEEGRPAPDPAPESPWTEPIDTARAQQDPPTIATPQDPDEPPHPGR